MSAMCGLVATLLVYRGGKANRNAVAAAA